MTTKTIEIKDLIQPSREIVKKYYDDDPELWDIIGKKINSIEKNGKLEADQDDDDEFTNDNILYILSRKYCTNDLINEMQPLYELWQVALHEFL